MARESFDKEIQFLRMLALTSGAYNRQQYAERLGISVHTFDKTLRRLKEIVSVVQGDDDALQGKPLSELLRYSYYDSSEPVLLFLYRAKSVKETESVRLSFLLAALQEEPSTALELLDKLCGFLPSDFPLPDEKTVRSDLKYLEEVGAVARESKARPVRYRMNNDLVSGLTENELTDLYDYVDVMANTQVPSVQGYLLRDSLKKALKQHYGTEAPSPFVYKYHYYSRILDEAHLSALTRAIRLRKRISFIYFSPKASKSYIARNTNPLFEKDAEDRLTRIVPLKVVYDHQYGRWYLLGYQGRKGIVKFRLEGVTQIEEGDLLPEEAFQTMLEELEKRTQFSWLIDTGRAVQVKVKFYNPEQERNFIKDRVLLQGQWGIITEEKEDGFLYEITVNGTTEIKPWLRSFGSSCEVLEPAYLRKEMIAEWKEIRTSYESVREDI
jgi:predicted DNA-binding transcriptional regulator YafY